MRVPMQLPPAPPCNVLLADDRPLVAAALAAALDAADLGVVAVCHRLETLGDSLLHHRPHVLVLSGSSTDLLLSHLTVMKAVLEGLVVVAVLEVDQLSTDHHRGVDVVLGPEAGIDQLVQSIHRARAGERFVASLVRERPPKDAMAVDLTDREDEVLQLMADGASNDAIADSLQISVNTVRSHVQVVLRKLGENRRVGAVRRAAELGLVAKLPA